uniref:TLC domain-containing protein n=1 Tax=Guillardia theta TaxID=55529 RepID=A0A7S4L847_GUITH
MKLALLSLGVFLGLYFVLQAHKEKLRWPSILRLVVKKRPEADGEVACRLLAILHAVLVCILSALSNLVIGPWAYSAVGEVNTAFQKFVLSVSLGYFLFDFLWCLLSGGETWLMIGHHGASIFCCLLSLMTNVSGSEVVGCLFGAEVSNPFLQARWFMLEAGLRETRACRIIEVTFALVFLSCRVFWAPTLLWVVVASPKPPQTIKVGAVLLQIISWTWSFFVAKKLFAAFKHLRQNDNQESKLQKTE